MLMDCNGFFIDLDDPEADSTMMPICFDVRQIESIAMVRDDQTEVLFKSSGAILVDVPYAQMRAHMQNAFFGIHVKQYGN